MKKIYLIFAILLICSNLLGLDFSKSSSQFTFLYGKLIANDKKVTDLNANSLIGGEFDIIFPSKVFNQKYLGMYKCPEIGLGLVYLDMGNRELTGQLFAAYPFMNLHFIQSKNLFFNIQPGVGVSFVTKTYGNTGGVNKVIGSMLNVYFALGADMEYKITNNLSLVMDISANHASNGNFKAPNVGYNMLNTSFGIKRYINYDIYNEKIEYEKLEPESKYQFEMIISGGKKQLYYLENKDYFTGSIVLSGVRNLTKIFKIGLGADLFYNSSYSAVNSASDINLNTSSYKRTYITENSLKNQFRFGLSVQPEFVFNRISAGIHLGIYLYNPLKNLEPYKEAQAGGLNKGLFYPYDVYNEDGWFYSRAALKYSINKNLFLSVGLKTHLNKSEFIEFGLGYKYY